MTEQEEIINTIKVLRKEVEVLTTRLRPAGTGHLHTAIGVINGRIDELIGKAIDGQPDEIRGLAGKIFDEDVYDGYKDHTEAMEQARLRKLGSSAYQRAGAMEQARLKKIQDSAAGRSTDGVEFNGPFGMDKKKYTTEPYEHTKEYYDTERNKSQSMTQPHKNVYDNAADIQNMSSDGLSNRAMKQKYGQAVQTTSEMMQEELEPLPINTFELYK